MPEIPAASQRIITGVTEATTTAMRGQTAEQILSTNYTGRLPGNVREGQFLRGGDGDVTPTQMSELMQRAARTRIDQFRRRSADQRTLPEGTDLQRILEASAQDAQNTMTATYNASTPNFSNFRAQFNQAAEDHVNMAYRNHNRDNPAAPIDRNLPVPDAPAGSMSAIPGVSDALAAVGVTGDSGVRTTPARTGKTIEKGGVA